MMNPLYPHVAEKVRMRRRVGSSLVSSATLGLRPIQVHNFGAKSGSHLCLKIYRNRRSWLNTHSFCIRGNFTTETQRARRFPWGYPRTHSQAVRASLGFSRCNTSILKQLPRTNAKFPNAKKRGQPLQQTFLSPADLGALCVSVVKSSSSATSSHALRRVRRFAFETSRRGLRWPCKYIHPQATTETTSNAARNSSGILRGRPLWRST
jgi:hypothetical protein